MCGPLLYPVRAGTPDHLLRAASPVDNVRRADAPATVHAVPPDPPQPNPYPKEEHPQWMNV